MVRITVVESVDEPTARILAGLHERTATVAYAHIFDTPFPRDETLARWTTYRGRVAFASDVPVHGVALDGGSSAARSSGWRSSGGRSTGGRSTGDALPCASDPGCGDSGDGGSDDGDAVGHSMSDGPLGFVAWSGDSLDALYVLPDAAGRGIGRQLISLAVGAKPLWVMEANASARRFYESLGWRPSGVTRHGYPGAPELEHVLNPDEA